jgi:hypothetical protein
MWSSVLVLLPVRAVPQLSPFDHGLATAERFQPYVSVATGLQYNVPLRLVIRQSGEPDIKLTAHYGTRPFSDVPYYDVKVGLARKPWAFELGSLVYNQTGGGKAAIRIETENVHAGVEG